MGWLRKMKISEKCLPCIVNQALKVADMVELKEKEPLIKKVFTYLSKVDYQTSTTPELTGEIYALLKKEIGNSDPYKEIRMKYNTMFLEQIQEFEHEIESAANPFLMAIKYAVMGNIIDFNPIHNYELSDIQGFLSKAVKEQLAIDHSPELMQEVRFAKNILYLGDNCGEICLDKIMLKKMKEMNPSCNLYFGTRGEAVVNDSIKEDALFVGIDSYTTVVSNGDYSLGTVLKRTSKEFQEIYDKADIIIAKGQANYECLSTEKHNIYFLLMTKCEVIANDIGVPKMKMVCMKNSII